MTNEELIQQILSKYREVSRQEILERFETEKEKTSDLIEEETLWRLIAAGYGIETCKRRTIRRMSINDLVAGLNDVTLTGLVIGVFPPRTFDGKRSGKVANLIITDKDATLGVVLWNDNVDLIESGELKAGQVVRFSHGYTREDREGKVELHMGTKSRIEVNPENVKAEEYPSLSKFAHRINEVTETRNSIHIAGTVKEVFPISTFKRNDKSSGKFLRLTLTDETGEIPVIVWNEKAEELEKVVKANSGLKLVNAKVKEKLDGKLEIHVGSYTYFEVLERLDF